MIMRTVPLLSGDRAAMVNRPNSNLQKINKII